jgi:hypothetical protein
VKASLLVHRVSWLVDGIKNGIAMTKGRSWPGRGDSKERTVILLRSSMVQENPAIIPDERDARQVYNEGAFPDLLEFVQDRSPRVRPAGLAQSDDSNPSLHQE